MERFLTLMICLVMCLGFTGISYASPSDNVTDNSVSIVVDGNNNLIIIANDGVTVAPPVDASNECPGPAIFDANTMTLIIPNVKVIDDKGIITMFNRVVLGINEDGTFSVLWTEQDEE